MSHYQSVFKPDLFKEQTIIITGGGSGIGRCITHELASLGAQTIILGRKQEKLDQVIDEVGHDGGLIAGYACDIRDEEAVHDVIKQCVKTYGRIDGLVNNAGGQYPAPLGAINKKGFTAVVNTNLVGGFLVAKEVYNQSLSRTGGSIVNMIADMWGGMPGMAHSGAARAGMDNFTKTAAFEWACSGVRVNAVAPGWIQSSGMDSYQGPIRAFIPKLKEAVPLKRLGLEAEVSGAVCFLLSPAAQFISGATLRIDGAASLGNRVWPLPDARNNEPFNGFHRAVTPTILQDSHDLQKEES